MVGNALIGLHVHARYGARVLSEYTPNHRDLEMDYDIPDSDRS